MAPGAKKGPNAKQEAGRAKKADAESKKQGVIDQQNAAAEAADWQKGSNVKRAGKEEEASKKEEEAARKRREKAELLAAEEEGAPSTTAKAKKAVAASKSKKKKNDLSFLSDALEGAADKKAKQKKADLLKKKQEAENAAKQKLAAAAAAAPVDPLFANTEKMIGSIVDDDADMIGVGRGANKARMEAAGTSGIDAALGNLKVTGPPKSAKATYADFEERMLLVVKADYQGLRLSQYKEKVYALWKKSPENPANQIPTSS